MKLQMLGQGFSLLARSMRGAAAVVSVGSAQQCQTRWPRLCRWICTGLAVGFVACSSDGDGKPGPSSATQPPLQSLRELTLLAGSLEEGGCGLQDGVGSAARLQRPMTVAIDTQGVIEVMERFGAIRRITPQGVVTSHRGPGRAPEPEANGTRFFPVLQALAIGADGSRYYAVLNDLRLAPNYGYDPKGWVIYRAMGEERPALYADPARQTVPMQVGNSVSSMAVDSRGRLLVADPEFCAVRRVEPDRSVNTLFTAVAKPGAPGCTDIQGLAVDASDGLAYVLSDGSVRRRSADGVERTVAEVSAGSPVNLSFDAGGRLIVSERDAQRVWAVTAEGQSSTLAASPPGPQRPRPLAAPMGVAADRQGNVFVADESNCTVNRIDANGRMTVLAGLPSQQGFRDGTATEARFGTDTRLAADAAGMVFIGDPYNRVIRRIDAAGRVSTWAGTPDPTVYDGGLRTRVDGDALFLPTSLAARADGRLVVLDESEVRVIGLSGEVSTLPTASTPGVDDPKLLLALGPDGGLFVFTGLAPTSCVRCSAQPTRFSLWHLGSTGAPAKLFDQDSHPLFRAGAELTSLPRGLAVSADGSVYFTLGHAVYRRDMAGAIARVAGSAESGYRDGEGDSARFFYPWGVALDPGSPGVVYVAEPSNHVIRKISAQGEVSTVLGRPGQPFNLLGAAPASLDAPREVQVVPGGLIIVTRTAVLKARE